MDVKNLTNPIILGLRIFGYEMQDRQSLNKITTV